MRVMASDTATHTGAVFGIRLIVAISMPAFGAIILVIDTETSAGYMHFV